jgi:hypothetical protein
MGVMNPYESPALESRPPFTLRRAIGLVLLIWSGLMAVSAAWPPIAMIYMRESRGDIIASGLSVSGMMIVAALFTFWLGWRRWSVSKELKQNYEHQQINAEADHQPSADLISQRADSAAEQHGDREQRSRLNRTGDDHVASGKRSQRHEDGHPEHPR